MDKLNKMFIKQLMLQKKIGYNAELFNQRYFEKMCIGCITELCEIIENTPWKNEWKKSSKLNIDEAQKEVVDLWHFVINISICLGFDSNKLFNLFMEKNKTNFKRQKHEY